MLSTHMSPAPGTPGKQPCLPSHAAQMPVPNQPISLLVMLEKQLLTRFFFLLMPDLTVQMEAAAQRLCLEGIGLLSAWSAAVLDAHAWKALRRDGAEPAASSAPAADAPRWVAAAVQQGGICTLGMTPTVIMHISCNGVLARRAQSSGPGSQTHTLLSSM